MSSCVEAIHHLTFLPRHTKLFCRRIRPFLLPVPRMDCRDVGPLYWNDLFRSLGS